MRRGQFADIADHDNAMRSTVSDIENSLNDVGVQLHPPMSYQYETLDPAPPVQIADAAPPKPKPVRKPRAKAAAKPKAEAGPLVEEAKPRRRKSAKTVEAGS